MRYLYGGIMCVGGSMIIILNEKKSPNQKKTEENSNKSNQFGVFIGVILSLVSVIFYAIINIASKILMTSIWILIRLIIVRFIIDLKMMKIKVINLMKY